MMVVMVSMHLPVEMMSDQWWIVLQILLLVLHLMKEEKCSFTMDLRRQESTPLYSRQVCCGSSEVVLTVWPCRQSQLSR